MTSLARTALAATALLNVLFTVFYKANRPPISYAADWLLVPLFTAGLVYAWLRGGARHS